MKKSPIDIVLAVWIATMGICFFSSFLVELQDVTRNVYLLMLAFCVVTAALSITKRVSGRDK